MPPRNDAPGRSKPALTRPHVTLSLSPEGLADLDAIAAERRQPRSRVVEMLAAEERRRSERRAAK